MAEAVPVRCPACQRENGYISPVFPCACGSPVTPPLDLAAPPLPLTHRTWQDSWVTVRCGACGRESEWPHPEVGCGACGTVVLVPVRPPAAAEPGADPEAGSGAGSMAGPAGPDAAGAEDGVGGDGRPAGRAAGSGGGAAGAGRGPASRPPFRPVTIRTARDAVATAALYLRWLGFRDVRQPDGVPIPSAAVDLRAPGVVAQVDATTAPAGLRAVECVWLNGLTASATSVYFALAGYTEEARGRADDLGIPLFVMDLTGMPQPVNDPADALVGRGA
ncbi:hypothetical protein WDV06_03950 [Streptomyces racemochromogenes]|uniref:Restriction endonuclease type IV Mrr domain-containing protein n=1 Tax=Streptomyces racemochromogenes TaxID=67353 RepID=A0ABW7P7G3_9ACTN